MCMQLSHELRQLSQMKNNLTKKTLTFGWTSSLNQLTNCSHECQCQHKAAPASSGLSHHETHARSQLKYPTALENESSLLPLSAFLPSPVCQHCHSFNPTVSWYRVKINTKLWLFFCQHSPWCQRTTASDRHYCLCKEKQEQEHTAGRRGKAKPPPSAATHHSFGWAAMGNHIHPKSNETTVKYLDLLYQHVCFYSLFYAHLLPKCWLQGHAQKGRNMD